MDASFFSIEQGRLRMETSDGSTRDNREPCMDYKNGRCFRDNCRYSHADVDGNAPPPQTFGFGGSSAEPCMDFRRGRCSRNDCRFSHADPDGKFGNLPPPREPFGGSGSNPSCRSWTTHKVARTKDM